MTTVILDKNINTSKTLDIVNELRAHGLVQGVDFDFAYYQARHDPINGHLINEPYSAFSFYGDAEYALIFKLKYSA